MQLLLPTLDPLAALHRRGTELAKLHRKKKSGKGPAALKPKSRSKVKSKSKSKPASMSKASSTAAGEEAAGDLLANLTAAQAKPSLTRSNIHQIATDVIERAGVDEARALRMALADRTVTLRFAALQRADGDISRLRARRAQVDEDATCSMCRKEDSAFGNPILICESCEQGWHQKCYGVDDIPAGDWFCSVCSATECAPLLRLLMGSPSEAERVVTQSAGKWKRMALELLDITGIADRISRAQSLMHAAKPPLSLSRVIEELSVGLERCKRYAAAPWLRFSRDEERAEQRRCLDAAHGTVCSLVRRALAEMNTPLPIAFVAPEAATPSGGARSPMRSPMRGAAKGLRKSSAAPAAAADTTQGESNFCLCKREWKADDASFMLGCSSDCCRGGEWFHPRCLGLVMVYNGALQPVALRHPDSGETSRIDADQDWLCPNCAEQPVPAMMSRKRSFSKDADDIAAAQQHNTKRCRVEQVAKYEDAESETKLDAPADDRHSKQNGRPRQKRIEHFFTKKDL